MSGLLLTPEEAATILGLSPFTVRRLLREGQLPGRKVGKRQWRIPRADLDEYLGASSAPSTIRQERNGTGRIAQLAAKQGVSPVTDFHRLLGDNWPEHESVEQFLAPIRELRDSSPAGGEL